LSHEKFVAVINIAVIKAELLTRVLRVLAEKIFIFRKQNKIIYFVNVVQKKCKKRVLYCI